ncbi:MAG: hypothetical protein VXB01_11180 [Opitutae bacterium]
MRERYDYLTETVEPDEFSRWDEVDLVIYAFTAFGDPLRSQVNLTFEKILKHLEGSGGKSKFGDKSSPEDIKREFQVSKKVFKQAIGGLYKQGKIRITNEGIELVGN